uniref:Uncharacterized protein n=1 Tax=viral metagenome TaxID=1070528 RepID=A0A6C0BF91_9ZZZZ
MEKLNEQDVENSSTYTTIDLSELINMLSEKIDKVLKQIAFKTGLTKIKDFPDKRYF